MRQSCQVSAVCPVSGQLAFLDMCHLIINSEGVAPRGWGVGQSKVLAVCIFRPQTVCVNGVCAFVGCMFAVCGELGVQWSQRCVERCVRMGCAGSDGARSRAGPGVKAVYVQALYVCRQCMREGGVRAGSRTVLAIGPAPDKCFQGLTDHLKLL